MDTRRDFIKKSAIVGAALCLPISLTRESQADYPDLKTRNPKKVLILWYSQTGQTHRYARLIGCILKGKDLTVNEMKYRKLIKICCRIMISLSSAHRYFIMILPPMSASGWKQFLP